MIRRVTETGKGLLNIYCEIEIVKNMFASLIGHLAYRCLFPSYEHVYIQMKLHYMLEWIFSSVGNTNCSGFSCNKILRPPQNCT